MKQNFHSDADEYFYRGISKLNDRAMVYRDMYIHNGNDNVCKHLDIAFNKSVDKAVWLGGVIAQIQYNRYMAGGNV